MQAHRRRVQIHAVFPVERKGDITKKIAHTLRVYQALLAHEHTHTHTVHVYSIYVPADFVPTIMIVFLVNRKIHVIWNSGARQIIMFLNPHQADNPTPAKQNDAKNTGVTAPPIHAHIFDLLSCFLFFKKKIHLMNRIA